MSQALLPPNLLLGSAAAPPPHAARTPPTPLRILCQNMYGAEEHEPQRRAKAFADALERLLPDVVGLQEVRRFNVAPLLTSPVLRREYPHLQTDLAGAGAGEPPWTLVLTRASVHMHRLGRRRYNGVGGWRGRELVHANISGRPVSFASLHLSAYDCPIAANAREEDAASTTHAKGGVVEEGRNATMPCPGGPARVTDLRAALEILARDGAPTGVLMGDFNFGARHDLFGLELIELRRHSQWRDGWLEAVRHHNVSSSSSDGAVSTRGWTWDNERNPLNKRDRTDAPLNFPSDRIDRVLLRGGLHAHAASLVNDEPTAGGKPLFLSDHFGVLIHAELREHTSAHRMLRGLMTLRPRTTTSVEG